MDQTLTDLIPPDFYLQKASGDGNCLFRAISRSVRDITGTFHHHMDLRHRCVSNPLTNPQLTNPDVPKWNLWR